jgi:hypothetical protein
VAVKVLHDADPDEEDVSRFVREATVAAGLQHPGITVVLTPTCTTVVCSSLPSC